VLLRILIITLLVSNQALASDDDLALKAAAINSESVRSLNISLSALAYLVHNSAGSYVPIWHLEDTGQINEVYELESAGYVKVYKSLGLPDGTENTVPFISIRPTEAGSQLRKHILEAKHNKAKQAGTP
jgi:hypothetical protein